MAPSNTSTLSIRVGEELLTLLDIAAAAQSRCRAHQAIHYIREGLRRDGFEWTTPTSGSPHSKMERGSS